MHLKCDDVVNGLGCDFVAKGETSADLKADIMRHGDGAHADLLHGLDSDLMQQRKIAMSEQIDEMITRIR